MTSGPSPDIGDLLREIDRDPMAVLWDGPSRLGHSHRTRAKVTDMIVFVLGRGTGRDFGESDPRTPNVTAGSIANRSNRDRTLNTRVIRVAPVFLRHTLGWC